MVQGSVVGESRRVVAGSADAAGLPGASATVVYGEAMLTMQTDETKRRSLHTRAKTKAPG